MSVVNTKTAPQKGRSRRRGNKAREALAAYGFLMPNFIGFVVFTSIPVVISLLMAFTEWNIFKSPVWVGLTNFKSLLGFHREAGHLVANDPFFWQYLYNTIYLMVGIPLGMASCLIVALMMNQKIKGVVVFRTIYFLPSVSAGVALLILWKYLFNPEVGLLNQVIRDAGEKIFSTPLLSIPFTIVCALVVGATIVGVIAAVFAFLQWICEKLNLLWPENLYRVLMIIVGAAIFVLIGVYGRSLFFGINSFMSTPPDWLGTVKWAKPSLIIMGLWGGLGGMNMILYLAALQGVPPSMYEAAEIDGAGGWKKFWAVTWPMISPTTFYILIMSIIGGFQSGFMTARIMTGGGPAGSTTTIEYYLYTNAFEKFNMGYASAISWFLFIVVFILTLVTWKVGGKVVTYE
ncbi:MAG: sugar ABC transporter permease [Armatimonadota bacterium]|nr:sugar ABC transporter permease [bacterium]